MIRNYPGRLYDPIRSESRGYDVSVRSTIDVHGFEIRRLVRLNLEPLKFINKFNLVFLTQRRPAMVFDL